jgi:hypothetical protein
MLTSFRCGRAVSGGGVMDAIETAARGGPVDLDSETRPELAALRGCPQTVVFHAEGDVAVHSRWVYDLAAQHARVSPGRPALN